MKYSVKHTLQLILHLFILCFLCFLLPFLSKYFAGNYYVFALNIILYTALSIGSGFYVYYGLFNSLPSGESSGKTFAIYKTFGGYSARESNDSPAGFLAFISFFIGIPAAFIYLFIRITLQLTLILITPLIKLIKSFF